MNPSIFYILCLCTLGLSYANGQRIELNFRDISGSKSPSKVACEPVGTIGKESSPNGSADPQILWQGSKFGKSERDTLRSQVPGQVLVPDIRLSASKSYRCALLSTSTNIDTKSLRNRIQRELASLPADHAACPPGYRLDQDRCYPCPAGSYTSGQDKRCYECPKDFFNSREASPSCQSCPEGTKTAGPGADNESMCLGERERRDSKGQPVAKTSGTVWIVVGICVIVFLVGVWILIAFYLLFWNKDDDGEVNFAQRIKRDLEKGLKRHHTYDTVAKDNIYDEVANENIYDSVTDDTTSDGYEVPIQRNKDHNYTEFRRKEEDHIYDEPFEPTKKQRKTSSEVLRQMPKAPPLPTKETDKKKIKEREAKLKAKKKEVAELEAKQKKDFKLEAARKAEAVKAIKEARAKQEAKEEKERKEKEKQRQGKEKLDDSDEHIYEEIRHVSVPTMPSDFPSSHGFNPAYTSYGEGNTAKPSTFNQ